MLRGGAVAGQVRGDDIVADPERPGHAGRDRQGAPVTRANHVPSHGPGRIPHAEPRHSTVALHVVAPEADGARRVTRQVGQEGIVGAEQEDAGGAAMRQSAAISSRSVASASWSSR